MNANISPPRAPIGKFCDLFALTLANTYCLLPGMESKIGRITMLVMHWIVGIRREHWASGIMFLCPGKLNSLARQIEIFILSALIPEVMAPLWDTMSLIYSQRLQSSILISFLHSEVSVRKQSKVAGGMCCDNGLNWCKVVAVIGEFVLVTHTAWAQDHVWDDSSVSSVFFLNANYSITTDADDAWNVLKNLEKPSRMMSTWIAASSRGVLKLSGVV